MGHRAHYAIRHGGQIRLFYSHWGARTVPEDVFFGPSRTTAVLDQLERSRVWLDDVWAEGGASIDHDQQAIAFFGGETDEDLIEGWLTVMRPLWAGWTVRWVDGMRDLAELLDVDGALLAGDPPDATPLPSQVPLPDAAPRIWEALRRNDARKDVLYAHARQTLGGLPPEPVYGEDPTHHPQFLSRIPSTWPGPVAAEAAFAFARAAAEGSGDVAGLVERAVRAAVGAEDGALTRDLLAAWGILDVPMNEPATVTHALDWLAQSGVDIAADGRLSRVRETV